ncbi:hypothetical protein KGD82_16275 [Nocardiopsis eucommiae]|uniref:Uncharacterized protein n=1 Tax=Nocardiopsis eucommiae TaxID=2831970 RepID=A0A975QJC6_9ACTN|nr:hypothetical protein KGD82_16275 [Nocardiopsis eucommiae]
MIYETDTGRIQIRVGDSWRLVSETDFPTAWQPITLRSGYTTPGHGRSPSWRFLSSGRVELRGTISRTNGNALPNNDYYGRLPAAARPNAWVRDVGAAESRSSGGSWGATCRLEVASENASNRLPGQIIAFHEHAPGGSRWTDSSMTSELPAWLASSGLWIGGAAAVVTGVTVITVGVRKVLATLRRVGHFLDDWAGEPARPGVDARPGVMERLHAIEHEVKYNHGTSLKDKVREVKEVVDELAARDPTPPVVQQDITINPDPPQQGDHRV